ncbi:MAG: ABC-F family ATP-binding cassette domain-containing protein [Oscillospiraceae bacterium]|nr:ABC-F family ATP-binding cassette domain-containing protein [Oscillospiraceae bacterium]
MVLTLENISKIYGDKKVLDNISLTIENADRIGLVGVNGCGKSTLLGIITGSTEYETQPEPNIPRLAVTKGMNIGFLRQNAGLDGSNTIIEEMTSVFSGLLAVEDEMRRLEKEMADAHDDKKRLAEISAEYDRKTAYFEVHDGYMINVRIRTVLNGMGFPPERDDMIVASLSGGEKTRLALCKLLLESPDLLILDEPTNHLDFDTVLWLEDYLTGYKGALLIVSHDRYFLDKLTTSTCEIERGRLKRYKGNYSAFVVQKKADTERLLKEYEAKSEEIAKLQDYVDRNLVRASTSAMAKSRMKKLEAMELPEKPVTNERKARLRFEYDYEPPLDVLSVKAIDVSVGEGADRKTLADNVSFEVRRGDKIGIIGGNGIGKSTLLKIIQQKLPISHGRIEWNSNTRISYFDQENSRLDPESTVMDEIHDRRRTMSDTEVRSLLALVRITGENVFKKVKVLSGGERAGLCFAVMMLERGNVLILDEPTNHLDISSKESLEEALCDYTGTVIFVSHDRYLLNKLAGRIMEMTENGAELFNCGFEGYMDIRRQRMLAEQERLYIEKRERAEKKAAENGAKAFRTKEQRARSANNRRRIKELEAEIERLEKEMAALQADMASPEVCTDYQLMNKKCAEYEEMKKLSTEYSDEWLMLSEEEEQ